MYTLATTVYDTVVMISLLTGIIIIGFAMMVFRKQRTFFEIQRKGLLSEAYLLEKERNRISRDLHDETGSLLQATKIRISLARQQDEQAGTYLAEASQYLNQVLTGLGQISKNLSTTTLSKKGLEAATDDFLEKFRRLPGMDIRFSYRINGPLNAGTSMQLYRIMQEMVQNAVKHSQATTLLVQFSENKKELLFLCKDNGKGFDTSIHYGGLGIQHLRNRSDMLGGQLQCISGPEKGTEYFLRVPKNKKI